MKVALDNLVVVLQNELILGSIPTGYFDVCAAARYPLGIRVRDVCRDIRRRNAAVVRGQRPDR